ncbi:malto-oligosyltrehalose synthase [Curtobacterium ammoniigenes]|uniref:malto-oligosyltrehalose synthase n=1 Tax=Curtobacterium ammoniigenes TaxID=395387 RepID=UPI0009F87F25|nr:malto-oligosyltrehalose synthase [Curtobacterium ammoniigenes]
MSGPHPVPRSTYRLQITPEFDLGAAADVVDYLRDLGADWVYLSPILEAEPGSMHGYDVVDHRRVDESRGGNAGLRALADAAHGAGLGVLVDIVPNHVGVATPKVNAWWWDLLTDGESGSAAGAFDVDWQAGAGRIRIPVLDDRLLDAVTLDGDRLMVGSTAYPTAPGTVRDGDDVATVHARQHYEFVHWTRADRELNYRRFFAVNTLAAIRVEASDIFEASHGLIKRWFEEGLVDGLRIDHPDGLFDPVGYLADLAHVSGGAYTLVEKILEPGEQLSAAWQTDGTTGYDALGTFERVLVDPAGAGPLGNLDNALRASHAPEVSPEVDFDWEALTIATRRRVADGILGSEVERLARLIEPSLAGTPHADLVDAIAEVASGFAVYRTYLPEGIASLVDALEGAAERRPDLNAVIDAIAPILADPASPAAIRLQQTSGMIMAKGVEDCAFYQYSRLTSLNEVGGDPSQFAIGVDAFHRANQERLAAWPNAMTTLTTHDTKRSEDTRARITALAEIGDQWAEAVHRLQTLVPLSDGVFANLLWQAIVGSWPASRERLHAYAEKAAREAGTSTSWTNPDEAFEAQMHALVDAAFDDPAVAEVLGRIDDAIREAGWSNGLSQKILQITGPGVPDVYQGTELWDRSLVDPDNRRPVDFAARRQMLTGLAEGILPNVDETGAAKLLAVSRTLRLRRDEPQRFTRYRPVAASGVAADHVIAADRGGVLVVATRLPIGLGALGGWGDTTLHTVNSGCTDVITGRHFAGDAPLRVGALLEHYPVAVLRYDDATPGASSEAEKPTSPSHEEMTR